MTTLKPGLLAMLAVLSAAGTVSAMQIDWEKDPVVKAKAEMAERKPIAPAVAAVKGIKGTCKTRKDGEPRQCSVDRGSVLPGKPIDHTNILPLGHQKSCLRPYTELVIAAGQVEAEYTCCKAAPADGKPDCSIARFSFPDLRYDADQRAILWIDEIIATHRDPEDHGPYWRFYAKEGFELRTETGVRSGRGGMADYMRVSMVKR